MSGMAQCTAHSRLLRRCTLGPDHEGKHAAYTDDGRTIDTWEGHWTIEKIMAEDKKRQS